MCVCMCVYICVYISVCVCVWIRCHWVRQIFYRVLACTLWIAASTCASGAQKVNVCQRRNLAEGEILHKMKIMRSLLIMALINSFTHSLTTSSIKTLLISTISCKRSVWEYNCVQAINYGSIHPYTHTPIHTQKALIHSSHIQNFRWGKRPPFLSLYTP